MYKKCKICGEEFWQNRTFDKCKCQRKPVVYKPRTPIKKVSDKRKVLEAEYQLKRILFLKKPENAICPVTGTATTDVHHQKGRIGDLLLDETFWLAVSRFGHKKIEENPQWAYENGYSLKRNEK